MEIAKLQTLVSLAETGSFSRAAGLLGTTQGNVSKHILSLEKELGVPLFERSRRQAVLTPEGRRLLPYAQELIKTHRAMLEALGGAKPAAAPEPPPKEPQGPSLAAILPVWHSLAKHQRLSAADLAGQTLLVSNDCRQALAELCRAAGCAPRIRLTSPRPDLLAKMAADGSGLAVVSTGSAAPPRGTIIRPLG